jgi:hypothetical protein
MAVVLATDTYETVRPVVRRLAEQTVKERLEVVIVAPLPPGALDTHRRELWQRLLAGRRPSLGGYVRVTGSTKGRSSPEAMDLRETRSNSQIPTLFPHRFPVNSHALPSMEGLWDKMRLARRFRRRLPRR